MKFKTFIDEATRKPEHTHAVTRGGNVVSYHTSSKSAHKKADSLDNQYGSTVHSVKLLKSAISEMIPYALSAANANAEHERARKAKKEEEKRNAKDQLDKDSEDNSNPFASMKSVKESHVKVGQRVKFNEPVAGTTRHTRKPMSFDGGKVVQVTPTGAMVRPQAWHGDEGLDVHVPHKNIKEEAIVEGGNYGKPYNNDADLKSKSNKELQSLHDFWKTRIEKDPNHSRAKGQLTKIKAILAGKIGRKTNEEVDQIDEAYDVNTHAEKIHKRVTNPRNLDRINTFAEIKKAYTAGRGKRGLPLFHSDVKRIPGYSLVDSNANGKSPNVSRIARGLLAAHNAGKKSMKEEVEQIDELKKSTLGKYIKKSAEDKADRQSYDDYPDYSRDIEDNERRLNKRTRGIDTAVNKLAKEEVELDEAKDKGEYDYEGDMAMSQLKSVIANAQKLHDMLKPDTNLPEWVQSKITLAEDYIVTATNYMDGELNEGLVSAIKRAFTPKPKEDQVAKFKKLSKERTQQNLGDAARRKPKQYSVRLPDAGRKPDSRSEYDANREMTKENYAIAAKQSQSFKTFRGGVKGKGTGSRRTQTNQVADHVKIYKESKND